MKRDLCYPAGAPSLSVSTPTATALANAVTHTESPAATTVHSAATVPGILALTHSTASTHAKSSTTAAIHSAASFSRIHPLSHASAIPCGVLAGCSSSCIYLILVVAVLSLIDSFHYCLLKFWVLKFYRGNPCLSFWALQIGD
jgi:hypothetical protein